MKSFKEELMQLAEEYGAEVAALKGMSKILDSVSDEIVSENGISTESAQKLSEVHAKLMKMLSDLHIN